jgi:hypothetical protein
LWEGALFKRREYLEINNTKERAMTKKAKGFSLALAAVVSGIAAIPVAAYFNLVLGLVMLALPIFFIYASG